MKLKGKTVLVTGAAKRIGKAIALGFAKKGSNILLHYHKSAEEAEETQAQIKALNVQCTLWQCDFTDLKSLEDHLNKKRDLFTEVSVLVNSASLFHETVLKDFTTEDSAKFFAVHYEAPLRLSRIIGLKLKDKKENGAIIHVTDAMLRHPYRKHTPYFASKGALETLTRSLAQELAPTVRVNAVAPGVILFPEGSSQETQEQILKSVPLRRTGQPEDIAHACVWLAEMDYVDGIVLKVDGGRAP